MKKIFIVSRMNFCDGGFGDCVRAEDTILKVFSTKAKAEKFIFTQKPFKEQDFQFGSGTQELFITSKTLL